MRLSTIADIVFALDASVSVEVVHRGEEKQSSPCVAKNKAAWEPGKTIRIDLRKKVCQEDVGFGCREIAIAI